MTAAAMFLAAFVLALSLVRFMLGAWLFTAPLTTREHPIMRTCISFLGLLAVYVALAHALLLPTRSEFDPSLYVVQLILYSIVLVLLVCMTLYIYETNIWTALFCCSAGYTVQNLASGLVEFVWTLMDGVSSTTTAALMPERIEVSLLCTGLIYVLCYVLITRHLLKDGLDLVQDRSMLMMMAVVILVIIGFDLVVKWLVVGGLAPLPMAFLRIFHGLACVFTLAMEFELLINRRLANERDLMGQLLVEHERQYEQSRENIAAINARVHDIRHSIGRIADKGGLDTTMLTEMVNEVAIYDSQVRTGNEALDTVLTEKRLVCEGAGISLTCIAEGAALKYMSAADIYALFSCLLDVVLAGNPQSVSFVLKETLGAISAHLESDGASALDEKALKPAYDLTGRYSGTLNTVVQGENVQVNILIPPTT